MSLAKSAHLRQQMLLMAATALAAVAGDSAVSRALKSAAVDVPLSLIAVGKAAQAMALGARNALGSGISDALLISKHGHLDYSAIDAHVGWVGLEAGHPLPDAASLVAGERLLAFIDASRGRPLLVLISGGASSLVEAPVAGIGLDELQRANAWLLASGLPIEAVNWVRKAVSRIKGGGLLRYLGARQVFALAISDVPGNDLGSIGSGLLVPEPDLLTGFDGLGLPAWLRALVEEGLTARGVLPLSGPNIQIVADNTMARAAAAEQAQVLGYEVFRHEALIEGEAEVQGRSLARALLDGPPGAHIWGGETVVTLPKQPGRGGRNQHLALAAAEILRGRSDCWFLSLGTDGSDGPTPDAGALVDGASLARADGYDVRDCLRRADAGTLLEASGDLINTGPTGTNVMDLMIGLKIQHV